MTVVVELTEEQAAAMGDLNRSLEYEISDTPSGEAFQRIAEALRKSRAEKEE